MNEETFLRECADMLWRIYLVTEVPEAARDDLARYYALHQRDYEALAYGSSDCRLSRFLHHRILPMCRRAETRRRRR